MGTGCEGRRVVSPSPSNFLTDDGLAMYNSSMLMMSEFEGLQKHDVTCPAMDGCQGEANGRVDKGQLSNAPTYGVVKSSWLECASMDLDVTDSLCYGVSFLAMMAEFFWIRTF